jgi:putative peptidoglycan lipid II flippase
VSSNSRTPPPRPASGGHAPDVTRNASDVSPPGDVTTAAPRSRVQPLQAAAVLAAAVLLARFIGLLQRVVLNGLLPAEANDAYTAAFRLPDIVNYLVAGGAMSVTFIPIFTQLKRGGHRGESGADDAWHFFSTVTTLMSTALLILIVLGMVWSHSLVSWLLPGFTEPEKAETLSLTVSMTRILLPAQFFFYLGGMIVGVLNAHKRFGASGLTGAIYNGVAILVGLLLWYLTGQQYPQAFAWGILIGAFCGNFLLPLLAARSGPRDERLRFKPRFNWRQPAVKRFFVNALPVMLGVSLPVVDQWVIAYFGSWLHPGSLRNLDTGNRFMLAPLGVLAQAASVAAFPYLASNTASEEWTRFSSFLRSGLRRLLFLALPLSTLLILLAQPIMSFFAFGEFQADRQAVHETSVAFAFYCVGLFAWAGQQFVARGFYAMQDTRTPTIIGSVLTIFFFIPICVLAIYSSQPVLGLALATSVGAAAHFCGIWVALDIRMRQRRYNAPLRSERVLSSLLRTATACLVMGLVGMLANVFAQSFLSDNRINHFLHIVLVTVVATIAFAFAASAFHVPEWDWLRDKVLRRRKTTA